MRSNNSTACIITATDPRQNMHDPGAVIQKSSGQQTQHHYTRLKSDIFERKVYRHCIWTTEN